MNDLIISVSGIRGIVGQGLTPEIALAFAAALATHTQGGKIIVSTDGRPSGETLKHAAIAGLLGGGATVYDVGVAPTPTIGVAVRKSNAAGGIQITASHNPAPWNGLKLFAPSGAVLAPADGEKILRIYQSGSFRRARWNEVGTREAFPQALNWHCDRVLQLVDAAKIADRHFKALVDVNGGAGGVLARQLLDALKVQSNMLGGDRVGTFLHEPEPTAANLRDVCPKVPQAGADLGFALDPDSDRLAIIDETGHYIGEELTLALAVAYRLRQQRGPVVINMSTSRVIEDIARQFGAPCHRSAVGEANVVALMNQVGAVIGGEGNGGVIDPRVGHVRDPFIGMGLVLNLLADTGKKLSEIVAELPAYTIVKDKYTIERDRLPALFRALGRRWPEAKANDIDGLRLDWPDRWVHVRPSNTEPIVRVIAEAPLADAARELCRSVGEMLEG